MDAYYIVWIIIASVFCVWSAIWLLIFIIKLRKAKELLSPKDYIGISGLLVFFLAVLGDILYFIIYYYEYKEIYILIRLDYFHSFVLGGIWVIWSIVNLIRRAEDIRENIAIFGFVIAWIVEFVFVPLYLILTLIVLYICHFFWSGMMIYTLTNKEKITISIFKLKVIERIKNFSADRTNKKQKKKEAKELEAKKFENLLRKSKELVKIGKRNYSKEAFLVAINNWEEAIKTYALAIKTAPTSEEKIKITENQKILRENICNANIENGKKHSLNAKKAYKKRNIQKAEQEWNSAKKSLQTVIEIIKAEKIRIDTKHLEVKINSIEIFLKRLKIEKLCISTDKSLDRAYSLKESDLSEAVKITQASISQYATAKKKAQKYPEFQDLVESIQTKIINARNFQIELQDKMDELIGITPITTKVIIDDSEEIDNVGAVIKSEGTLSIKREYEFKGGQIRFKIGLNNNTKSPLTNFKISFDIPKALKWIMHEPNYDRKGDSILISKIGINEKKAVSLYLEPINCMKSPINATVSFFDAKDRPQAIPMNPKMISITCPIFFTREEANLARVKRLQRTLAHRDKKILPIINPEKSSLIFSSVLSVLGEYDIKLIYKEYSEDDKFGEAWYYGLTKVKKNQHVVYILFDGKSRTLELEVSADDEGQITAFLAEIGSGIRQHLIEQNIISLEDRFYDIKISVLSSECPYCMSQIPAELVQKYRNGNPIKCKYCDCEISINKD